VRVIGWPFPVLVRGDVMGAGPAAVVVEWSFDPELSQDDRSAQVDEVACIGSWWCKLVDAGGGGGDRIAPDRCAATPIDEHQPERTPNRLKWTLGQLRIDPRALTILLNAILTSRIAVAGVTVSCHGGDVEQDVTPGDYPAQWRQLPFATVLARTERNGSLEIELASDVPPNLRGPLEEALQVWALLAGLGGFRDLVPLEQHSEIQAVSDVAFEFDLVSLLFRDNGAHEAAYAAVLNMMVRFAATKVPVRSVEIC